MGDKLSRVGENHLERYITSTEQQTVAEISINVEKGHFGGRYEVEVDVSQRLPRKTTLMRVAPAETRGGRGSLGLNLKRRRKKEQSVSFSFFQGTLK